VEARGNVEAEAVEAPGAGPREGGEKEGEKRCQTGLWKILCSYDASFSFPQKKIVGTFAPLFFTCVIDPREGGWEEEGKKGVEVVFGKCSVRTIPHFSSI